MGISLYCTGNYSRDAGDLEWLYQTGAMILNCAPALDLQGNIYLGNFNDSLFCISPTGVLNWAFTTSSLIKSSPALLPDGRVCVGDYYGNFYVVEPDGELSWSYAAGSSINYSPAVRYDGYIYFSSDPDQLYCFDFDGNLIWNNTLPEEIKSAPVIGPDGTLYLKTFLHINALNSFGSIRWQRESTGSATPIINDNRVYFFNNNYLSCVDNNGNTVMSIHDFDFDFVSSTPVIDRFSNIIIGMPSGQIRAYNQIGTYLWSSQIGGSISTGLLLDDRGNVYYGNSDDSFYCIASGGELNWDYVCEDNITSAPVLMENGDIIFASTDHNIYCLQGYDNAPDQYGSAMFGVDPRRTFSYYSNIYPNRNRIVFPNSFVNEVYRDTLLVFNNTCEELEIFWETNSDDFTIIPDLQNNPLAPDDSLRIIVEFSSSLPEDIEADLKLFTADPAAPVRNVFLYAHVSTLDPGSLLSYRQFESGAPSSPTLSASGKILIHADNELLCLNENLETCWQYYRYGNDQPVCSNTGQILITSHSDESLHCLNEHGNLQWSYSAESTIYYPPSCDRNGNIYFCDYDNLISLNPSGEERWLYDLKDKEAASAVTISADGTAYFVNSIYQLVGITANGLHKFTYQAEDYLNQPVVDEDGTIYLTTEGTAQSVLSALASDGSLQNSVNLNGRITAAPLLGANYLYVTMIVSAGSRIYCLEKTSFDEIWQSELIPLAAFDVPTLAQDGSLYVTTSGSTTYTSYLTALNGNGEIKWQFNPHQAGFDTHATGTPLITQENRLIFSSRHDPCIFLLHENAFLASSAWPTLGQNASHNSCSRNSIIPGPDILIDRDKLDFGIVELGNNAVLSVNVSNQGDTRLSFTAEITGAGFDLVEQRYILEPGDSLDLNVSFEPEQNEDPIYQGNLVINSDDIDQPLINVDLSGKSSPEGELIWKIHLDNDLNSTPALAADGTIYIDDHTLYAISSDGSIKWIRDFFASRYPYCVNPTVSDNDAVVYLSPMIAVDSSGVLLFNTPIYDGFSASSVALDHDNHLYFGKYTVDNPSLNAYDQNGEFLWDCTMTHSVYHPPVIDPEGKIYFGGSRSSGTGEIICLDQSGSIIWLIVTEINKRSLALGFNEELFSLADDCVGMGDIRVVLKCHDRNNGDLIWEFMVPNPGYGMATTCPVIDRNGNIYFGNAEGELYCVDSSGQLNWYYQTYSIIYSTPAVGANGVIYFGCNNGCLYALNPDGTLRWQYQTESAIDESIVINPEGVIYFTNTAGYLYAINGLNGGLDDSPWPMIHQNPRHNCRHDLEYTSLQNELLPSCPKKIINYPNPFNPSTTFSFLVPDQQQSTEINIYNVKGEHIRRFTVTPPDQQNDIFWDGRDKKDNQLDSGIYLYQLKNADRVISTGKCILLK